MIATMEPLASPFDQGLGDNSSSRLHDAPQELIVSSESARGER